MVVESKAPSKGCKSDARGERSLATMTLKIQAPFPDPDVDFLHIQSVRCRHYEILGPY
jgi:hypothetical protein